MPTATATTTMVYPSHTTLKSSTKSVPLNGTSSASSTAATLRSLYSRAARAFLHRDISQTHSLIESAFQLLKPPALVHDALADHRKKWDILRVTLETTVFADPPSMNSIPPLLKSNMAESPQTLMSGIYARSLGLFTPVVGPSQPPPNAAYLPSTVLITLLYSSLKIGCPELGRMMAEQWLSKRESPLVLNSIPSGQDSDEDGYEKVVEIYTLHILPKLEQWQYAKEFLQFESDLPEHTREFMRSRLNALHAETLASHRPRSQSGSPSTTPTPRSHSPTPSLSSSSSLSTTSTHTIVPATSRGSKFSTSPMQPIASSAAVSVSSKASSEGTATPTPRGRNAELPNGHAHALPQTREGSSSASSAASAPRTNIQVTRSTTTISQPTILSLVKASFAPYVSSSKLATFLILFVLFPIVSWVLRIRHRRRKMAAAAGTLTPSAVDIVRRRLQVASASESGFAKRLWDGSIQAVLDTVKMAGSGLV